MTKRGVVVGAALATLLTAGSTLRAQTPPKPAPIPIKIQIVVTRYDGEKKIASLPYVDWFDRVHDDAEYRLASRGDQLGRGLAGEFRERAVDVDASHQLRKPIEYQSVEPRDQSERWEVQDRSDPGQFVGGARKQRARIGDNRAVLSILHHAQQPDRGRRPDRAVCVSDRSRKRHGHEGGPHAHDAQVVGVASRQAMGRQPRSRAGRLPRLSGRPWNQ